jgi:hypothetical protein
VIQPDSLFKVVWDSLVIMVIIVNIFYIPMKLSFNFENVENIFAQIMLETLPSWVLVCDIVLTFNTAYYRKGMIHT